MFNPRRLTQKFNTLTALSSTVESEWLWRRQDPRYVSDLEISWDDVIKTIESVQEGLTIGVLNFGRKEIRQWREVAKTKDNEDDENVVELDLEHADKNVTWDALYPEWIDEEQEKYVHDCPNLPKIKVPTRRLDLVVVKLPCLKEGNWSRDVARLHLQMAAATVAASAKGQRSRDVCLEMFPDAESILV
ncbi:hypothetical protein F2Q70_00023032 [Brassica cretica]|uniref:Uncharacterized protein n=1 Tax=Brassica cretica TaxID=69181 RepID=A0A8S9GJ21_BRACR|nr:hypothetical protein F2Q70_00023032 [Brassica cretica]